MTAGDPQASGACPRCGEPLAPKAAFCRACGAKYEPPSCGRCGAALAPNSAFCRTCGTPVPAEGAPTERLEPAPSPAPPKPPTPPHAPAAPAQPAGTGGPRSRTPFIIGALVLLIGAGIAVAIVASRNSNANDATTTVNQVGLPGPEASDRGREAGGEMVEAEEEPVEAEDEVSSSGFPEVSRAQMNEEITSLLQSYHEDVVEEDFQAAWAMLSPRKRGQYLREYGYRKWATAQASLSPYLDPYGLEADVVSLEGEGVARVDVTGMGWSKPGAPCSEWSGLTWVKFEGDEWAYDPGYSTTPQRRATWRPRSARLLGGDCAE